MKSYPEYYIKDINGRGYCSWWHNGNGTLNYQNGCGETTMYGNGWNDYPIHQLSFYFLNTKIGVKK